ncbi:MAG: DNA polymerase [Terriglobus sp.]
MPDSLNWLFVDLNSYFASVEQELQPELRGRPIAIVPVEADSACCIALSYQAKAYGLRTGIRLAEAKAICPQIIPVFSRPRLYVEYHHKIIEAIERCVPVQSVQSCDEFACELMGSERSRVRSVEIAYAIKREVRAVGSTLRCSIGIAPNRFLAKIATDMQKPDGLMTFEREALPHALYALKLSDLPGVGRSMEKRLHAAGIRTIRELCALRREQMSSLWGNVWGDRMWLWMRGEDFLEPAGKPLQTLSRQHILPPDCRTWEKSRAIALKLLLSTARRMRRHELWAGGIGVHIGYQEGQALQLGLRIPPSQDIYTIQQHFFLLWERSPKLTPSDVTVVLFDLAATPQRGLFDPEAPAASERITSTVDQLNLRYGLNTVYPGSIHAVRNQAPTRIPFVPPPLEEFDDTADEVRAKRVSVRKADGIRAPYPVPKKA